MRPGPKTAWFLSFSAVFAALSAFVFYGTWSTAACPVMPDAAMSFPLEGSVRDFIRDWIGTGRFIPWDASRLTGTPYFWQELQYALALYFSGLGLAYWLRGRGLSRPAAYGAGLLLGFCGYWATLFSAGHAGWFRWMFSGVFAFGLADRAVRKGKAKNWLLLGACVAWASFYQPDLWLLFTVLTGAYFVWCCVRERKAPSAKGLALAAAAFFAIGAPSIRHAFVEDLAGRNKQVEESQGTALTGGKEAGDREGRWIFVTNWSLPPAETLEFAVPRINGDTSCPWTLALGARQGTGVTRYVGALGRPYGAKSGNYRQHSLYVGWMTCLLALAAVAAAIVRKGRGKREEGRGDVAFLAIAAVVCWMLSLGRYCEPVYRLVFMLPIGDSIRAPVKWHHLTELCLCALAGYGLEALRARLASFGLGVRAAAFAAFAAAVVGAADLARIDRLYCAAVDLSLVKNANAAADDVLARGGGKVADLAEGGNGALAWSFSARRIPVCADPQEADARFVWIPAQRLADARVSRWLEAKGCVRAGSYAVVRKAVARADERPATLFLYEKPGVAPSLPAPEPMPPATAATWLGVLSLFSTIFVAAYGAKKS